MNRLARFILSTLVLISFLLPPTLYAEDKTSDDKEGSFSIEGIEVIQNRLFQKRGRHELSLSVGTLYDNSFVFYEVIPIRYSYFFRESLGIELTGAFAFGQEKGLVQSLRQPPVGVDVKVEKIKRYYTGNFIWSPVYGKFNIFASLIVHFDLYLTTGFGMMDNAVTVDNTKARHFAFNIGAGAKIYMNNWIALRLDFRNYTFKEGTPFNDTVNNRILSLGVSFFLPPNKKAK